jgi:hypothetical protein
MRIAIQANGSCPYWVFFDPAGVAPLLLVDEKYIVDNFPKYLAQLQLACDSFNMVLMQRFHDPFVLILVDESIEEVSKKDRYQQCLAESYVTFPSGSLICSIANKMATVSSDGTTQIQTVKPGIYELHAFRLSRELVDNHLRAEMAERDRVLFKRVEDSMRLGCLLTVGVALACFGLMVATALGPNATSARLCGWLLLAAVFLYWCVVAIIRRSSRWRNVASTRAQVLQKHPELVLSLTRCDLPHVPQGAVRPFIDLTAEKPPKQTEIADFE